MADAGSIIVRLLADASQYMQAMGAAGKATGAVGTNMAVVSRKMETAGKKMTRAVTLPVLALGAVGAKLALNFEDAFTDIEALVGASADEIAHMREAVLDLAPAVGKGPQELAEALYFITSSGLEGSAALDALKASATAAAAGLGDTMTIADAVTSAINAYGLKNLSAAKTTDILTAAVREGKSEPEEFAGSIGRVIPLASKMGVEFGEVAGIMAAMSLNGTNANEAVTQITAMLSTAVKPTKEGAEALKSVGESYASIRKRIADDGLLKAIEHLNKAFDGDIEKTAEVFGNIRALRGILALTGPEAKKYAGIIDRVAQAHGDAAKAAEIALSKPGARLEKAWAGIQASLIRIGDIALPVFAEIADEVAEAARWFGKLDDSTKKNVLTFGLVAAAAGPALSIICKTTKGIYALRGAYLALSAAQTGGALATGAVKGAAAGGAAAAASGAGMAAVGGAFAGMVSLVPAAAISAAVATAIVVGVREGTAEAGRVAAAGGSGWEQFFEGLKAGLKAPGIWFQETVDKVLGIGPTITQKTNDALNTLASKAAASSGKQFTKVFKEYTALKKLLEQGFDFGNINAEHTDSQLRSIRDRIISTTGLTRKQADHIMSLMFKDWRPQPVVMGKINPAMSAVERRIDRMRAQAAKPTKFGAADNRALISSIGAIIGQLHNMEGAANAAAQAASMAAHVEGAHGRWDPTTRQRAAGGPVAAGQMYLVGERGPELFTAPSSGRIIPNNQLSGGSSGPSQPVVNNTFYVTIDGYDKSVDEIWAELEEQQARMSRAV